MSEYGLEIFNLNGGYLLSSEWSSYAILESGVLQSSTSIIGHPGIGNTGTKLTLPDRGLLFVKPSIHYDYSIVTAQNDLFVMGSNQVGVVVNRRSHTSPTNLEVYNHSIPYFIAVPFEDIPSVSTEGYGLAIYKSNGALAFSTNAGYLALVDSKNIPAANLTTGLYSSPMLFPLSNAVSKDETWACLNLAGPFGTSAISSFGDTYVFSMNVHVGLEYTGAIGYSYSLRVSAKDVGIKIISGRAFNYSFTFPTPRNILIAERI